MLGNVLLLARGMAAGRGLIWWDWYYGWTLVAVSFLTVGAALGTRAAFGVLLVPLADALGSGRALASGALALCALLSAVSSPPLGAALDRWGPQRVFAVAGLIAALGLALTALSQTPWEVYLGLGGLVGVGLTPLRPQSMGVVISQWFVKRRGLALASVSSGIGLGVLVLAPVTQAVLGQASWQAAFLMLAAVFALGVVPLNALLQRHRPEDCGLLPDGAQRAPAGSGHATGTTVREALHQPRFWVLGVGLGLGAIPLNFVLAHGVAHLVDGGLSPQLVATTLGLGGGLAAGAMLLWGLVADRWGGAWAYTGGSLALMAALVVLALVTRGREPLLWLYVPLFALGFASRQGLVAFLVASVVGRRSLGALMGVVGALIALGTAVGPALGGWVYDHTGSYGWAFALSQGAAVLAVAGVWLSVRRTPQAGC